MFLLAVHVGPAAGDASATFRPSTTLRSPTSLRSSYSPGLIAALLALSGAGREDTSYGRLRCGIRKRFAQQRHFVREAPALKLPWPVETKPQIQSQTLRS